MDNHALGRVMLLEIIVLYFDVLHEQATNWILQVPMLQRGIHFKDRF